MLKCFRTIAKSSLLFFLAQSPSYAEPETDGGRWITRGTFALSNLQNNPLRVQSYARSDAERSRLLTFLPAMTIIYQIASSDNRDKYYSGLTHTGIPVDVLKSEVSNGAFDKRSVQDVVVHRTHKACRNITCVGDSVPVALGESFKILSVDDQKVELISAEEKEVVYRVEEFKEKETSGYITSHKERINPRWTISDGYAAELSTGCGETRSSASEIVVSLEAYNEDPAKWSLNDPRWSLKAIQVFDLGEVKWDENSGNFVGRLARTIQGKLETPVAVDLTVLSYRASQWKDGFHKFAGLMQIVHCEATEYGLPRPRFAHQAFAYFDLKLGDKEPQTFPLGEIDIPQQLSFNSKGKIFDVVNRTFFYSINSAEEYEELFEEMSKKISPPTAVANIISRLNASCAEKDRKECIGLVEGPTKAKE